MKRLSIRGQAGDLIFCHTKSASDVRPGDVIAFFDPAGNGKSIVTHRVESITTDENGSLAWVTKGDANNVKDNAVVPAKNLAGVYRRRIQGLGNAVVFMQTSKGMMVCVVFPILLFVMYFANVPLIILVVKRAAIISPDAVRILLFFFIPDFSFHIPWHIFCFFHIGFCGLHHT